MNLDFNNAAEQRTFDIIPADTIATAIKNQTRPGR